MLLQWWDEVEAELNVNSCYDKGRASVFPQDTHADDVMLLLHGCSLQLPPPGQEEAGVFLLASIRPPFLWAIERARVAAVSLGK